ncbi:MAG: hypothetical protein FJ077_11565, partial [Cyanobacteria bacterium K_DeepCast_35m_m2_023]|nr:hypothetical protein [Cyanobacteria bacterium K_DeepCast_35m_m2_023]
MPKRVRLQWTEAVSTAQIDQLCGALNAQSWLRQWCRRDRSRTLVLELAEGCSAVRWQLALASLGWQLQDESFAESRDRSVDGAADAGQSAWFPVLAQIGAGMVGSAAGQLLLGGLGAGLGMVWMGPRAALVLGGLGAVVGGIVGSTVASAWADGRAAHLREDLGTVTLHRLSTRLGEQAGASSGRLLGTALAGPLGGVAGLALGSLLIGHLAADLTDPQGAQAAIGNRRWLAQIARQEGRDAVTERVGQV